MAELNRRRQRPALAVAGVVRPRRITAHNDNIGPRAAPRWRRRLVQLIIISAALAAALAVASCGRRGAPELPASAASEPRAPIYPTDPDSQQVPNRKFVLDPLLQ